jgi:hypothetical protein
VYRLQKILYLQFLRSEKKQHGLIINHRMTLNLIRQIQSLDLKEQIIATEQLLLRSAQEDFQILRRATPQSTHFATHTLCGYVIFGGQFDETAEILASMSPSEHTIRCPPGSPSRLSPEEEYRQAFPSE